MADSILVSIISGGITLIGTIITVIATGRKTDRELRASQAEINETMRVSQAVMDTKIEELTREVRIHNNFAQRVPVVEEQIKVVNKRINDSNERISRLEKGA